jgi:cytochrome oxidase Cu insertion factor (SCO1/SenC/PrrC family)
MSSKPWLSCAALALLLVPGLRAAELNAPTVPKAPETQEAQTLEGLDVPDVPVLDQEGRSVLFNRDLVAGKLVAVNFIFTHCTTICPPLAATFGKLRKLLGDRAGRDVHLISISVDPANDTPAALKAWSQKFGPGPGWTLVTGGREDMTRLLKSLGAYTADKNDHPPLVLIGNGRGRWTRAYGLAPPAKLAAAIDELAALPDPAPAASPAATAPSPSPAQSYLGDTLLQDQDGQEHRFYTDLVRGRIVVMDFIYTRCVGPCPILSSTFARLQTRLGDRLGKDVFLLSFSVDPDYDTPARLKEYAGRFHARPGWTFLTGSRQNVETVLRKLGQWVETPEDHQTIFILGNEHTGLWKKAVGLAKPEDLFPVIDSVLDDKGTG